MEKAIAIIKNYLEKDKNEDFRKTINEAIEKSRTWTMKYNGPRVPRSEPDINDNDGW